MLSRLKALVSLETRKWHFWVISFLYLALFITFLIVMIYVRKFKEIESFAVSSFLTSLLVLFVLIFRWGFLKNTWSKQKEMLAQNKQFAEERKLKKYSAEEKRVYLKLKAQKEKAKKLKEQNKVPMSNFVFYLNLFIYTVIAIPLIIISLI